MELKTTLKTYKTDSTVMKVLHENTHTHQDIAVRHDF